MVRREEETPSVEWFVSWKHYQELCVIAVEVVQCHPWKKTQVNPRVGRSCTAFISRGP